MAVFRSAPIPALADAVTIPGKGVRKTLACLFAFCYHRIVSVISKRGLLALAKGKRVDNETLDELNAWYHAAHTAAWRSLGDVRRDFADADRVGSALIFNICHNRYHLIVRAEFSVRLVLVKALLTHNEYDREEWKKWA